MSRIFALQKYTGKYLLYNTYTTKDLSKAIMHKSKIKNMYQKWPSRENFLTLKKTNKIKHKI